MTGAAGVFIGIGVRLVVFSLVFWLATRRSPKIAIHNKWTIPLIGLVFTVLDTVLYWALTPILDVATLGALNFAMPLVANVVMLAVTVRVFQTRKWLTIEGLLPTLWLALALTVAHGACWLGLDYLPAHV